MRRHIQVALLAALCLAVHSRGKILRNNALMTKMISHFQQDNNLSVEPHRKKDNDNFNAEQKDYSKQEYQKQDYQKQDYQKQDYQKQDYQKQDYEKQDYQKQDYQSQDYPKLDYQKQDSYQRQDSPENQKPEKILNLMQNVLCRNFPSIPCKIIMQDDALNKLIQRSIQQIKYKKMRMEHTTQAQLNTPTLYPIINSEDLSNFLEVSNTGYFDEKTNEVKKTKKKKRVGAEKKMKNHWSHEKPSKKKIKGSKDTKHGTEVYNGRKKMRKFYPHKIKYKDKNSKNNRGEFRDVTEEKMSMSIELPDLEVKAGSKVDHDREHMTYKVEPADSPVWRIDYMKHGVPSLNMFGYEDERLRGKIIKSGPNVIVDENGLEQPVLRKEVLHPDVYIKKNFVHKNTMNDDNLE